MQSFVELYPKQDYSPEQITGYAIKINRTCVSPERIYQFVRKDKKEGGTLYEHLRTRDKKYKKRGNTIDLLEEWMPLIHTITSDNGKEFANHKEIAEELNIDFFFARPYHSRERGANENLNGLAGQYFPKKSDFDLIEKDQVEPTEKILNNRPRKRYGYLTPNEVFVNAINNNGIVAFMT
ncbi:hypothetical protein MNBD_BACTEROID03-899 [hydrothermal vent metagenome]|uniref:Integrase catalytic domain-containing protein n=1 Tax=hydrothermal vent metagenome TaxID=652676 RepID=A0A3B0SXU9_9ZZZZ